MKFCLGIITGNDEEILKKHLPIISKCFTTKIAVDSSTLDRTNIVLKENGFIVYRREWDYNYSEARNLVIQKAEELGMEAMLMLDSDECMFPKDIEKIRKLLEQYEAIKLPRYEFGPTKEWYNPTLYPDYQGRAFQLNKGYHYRNKIHEILYRKQEEKSIFEQDGFYPSDETHIYHYGRCKDLNKIWLKYENYRRIQENKKILLEIPKGVVIEELKDVINWNNGQQPI